MVVDLYLLYEFLKRLTTPFTSWDAYKLGIIDEKGEVLKKRRTLGTNEERKAWGYFDILAANLKKLLEKLPGGSSKIGTFAAALLLLKEHENNPNGDILKETSDIELKYKLIEMMDQLKDWNKKYVAIKFTEETNNKLYGYALEHGFDLTVDYDNNTIDAKEFDFHTTVFYTSNEVIYKTGTKNTSGTAKVTGFKLLGKNQDVPVLTLDNGFRHIRKEFENLGFKDEWPSWIPYISLSYNRENIPNIKNLVLPDFPIVAKYLVIKDQDPVTEEAIANVTGNSAGLTGEPPVDKKKKKKSFDIIKRAVPKNKA